jgi:hypothetical protein
MRTSHCDPKTIWANGLGLVAYGLRILACGLNTKRIRLKSKQNHRPYIPSKMSSAGQNVQTTSQNPHIKAKVLKNLITLEQNAQALCFMVWSKHLVLRVGNEYSIVHKTIAPYITYITRQMF